MNFPLLSRILKICLHDKLTANESNTVKVTNYPAVRGYMLEMKLFSQNHLDVTILANSQPLTVRFNIPYVTPIRLILKSYSKNVVLR